MPEDIDKIEVAEVSAILDKNGDIVEDFDKPKKKNSIHIEYNSNKSFLGKIISILLLLLAILITLSFIAIVIPMTIGIILIAFLINKIKNIFNNK